MKKNIGENLKDVKGITLVALIVTIIVLLILAGVTLSSVLSQDGIFHRAGQAVDKHGEAKARETLEIALGEAQMQKYEQGLTDEQLTNKINEIGEELPKEKPEHPELQNVIVDGHIFEIDRSVPKIVDYIGPANGVIITAIINGLSNGWMTPNEAANITVTGRIKTYSGGTITSVNATKDGTAITGFSIDNDGKYTIDNITADTTIVINAKDSNNKENTKTIPITIRIDNVAPTLSEVTATAEIKPDGIIIKATATDNESGIQKIEYSVRPTTVNMPKGILTSGKEIELIVTEEVEYTITFTAMDNAENISEPSIAKATPKGGVIKHIKTSEGLKEVNTVDIYGVTVTGYDCTRTDAEWQIFYIDEEDNHRVYLIAKDYMVLPTNTELTKSTNTSYPKAYYFNTTVLNKYKTTIPNTTFTAKFLSDYVGTSASSQENYQATNYMLDQSMWQEYMSTSGKSDYAFGGPTLPLFQASYNDTCRTATKLGIQKSGKGYQVNLGGGSWENEQGGYGDTSTQNGIYFHGDSSNSAFGMWLASPAATDASYIENANYGGYVGGGPNYAFNLGFRPIVSLKSDVIFTDNGNGTYTIN